MDNPDVQRFTAADCFLEVLFGNKLSRVEVYSREEFPLESQTPSKL